MHVFGSVVRYKPLPRVFQHNPTLTNKVTRHNFLKPMMHLHNRRRAHDKFLPGIALCIHSRHFKANSLPLHIKSEIPTIKGRRTPLILLIQLIMITLNSSSNFLNRNVLFGTRRSYPRICNSWVID